MSGLLAQGVNGRRELVPRNRHASPPIQALAPNTQRRAVHVHEQPLEIAQAGVVRGAQHIRGRMPPPHECDFLLAHHSDAQAVQIIEEGPRWSCELQLAQGLGELSLGKTTPTAMVNVREELCNVIMEALLHKDLELGQKFGSIRRELSDADGPAAVAVEELPHGASVTAEAHLHTPPLEDLLSQFHVLLHIEHEPSPHRIPKAPHAEGLEVCERFETLLLCRLAGDCLVVAGGAISVSGDGPRSH
mmetsp:Transcript_17610/g.50088  ORF Transcript_17610/g.50088 Transcript_17610/m.50088 type:complete len:246 (+) Transcript_17610:461-1198(+)